MAIPGYVSDIWTYLIRTHPFLLILIVITSVIVVTIISLMTKISFTQETRDGSRHSLKQIISKIRYQFQYISNQFSKLPVPYQLIGFTIVFLLIGLSGYLILNGAVEAVQESSEIARLLFGCTIVIGAAIMTGTTGGILLKWGANIGAKYFTESLPEPEEVRNVEMVFTMLGAAITSIPTIMFLSCLEIYKSRSLTLWHSDPLGTFSLWQIVLVATIAAPFASYFWRRANVTAYNLGINAISFATPAFALVFLWIFGQVGVAHSDYFIIGASAIIVGNLIINFDAEKQFGFKSLILSLWLFGMAVYLRDPIYEFIGWKDNWLWSDDEFFTAVALSATIFTLILSFRVARLVERTRAEENLGFALFSKLELLTRRGVVDERILKDILVIDESEQRPEQLRISYEEALRYISEAKVNADESAARDLSQVEGQLNSLVHSKELGPGFGELSALYVFAGLTVVLAVVSRPDEVVGWTAFLIDMFAMLFSSVIMFLLFNVGDIRQRRLDPTLGSSDIEGVEGYSVVFQNVRRRIAEERISLVVGGALVIMYGVLIWSKFLNQYVWSPLGSNASMRQRDFHTRPYLNFSQSASPG